MLSITPCSKPPSSKPPTFLPFVIEELHCHREEFKFLKIVMATHLPCTTITQYTEGWKQGTLRKEHCPRVFSQKVHIAFPSFSSLYCSSELCHVSYPLLSSYVNNHGRQSASCHVVTCLSSSSPSSTSSSTIRLYVSGLSFRTTEANLRNAFEKFGQLVEVNLVMDRVANRPRGFAFLSYATEEESKKAIEGMHGKFLDGRVIFVEEARPRSEVRKNKPSARESPY